MTDATILIPTFRHASVLPYAIESALDQQGASIELFVVGDGVEDPTREVLARHADDARVHFFDLPKGPRLGEAHRHPLLPQAAGRIVTYLSDDDLFLRDHVVTMLELLEDADFAHPPSARFAGDGTLFFFPWDYSRPEFREIARGRVGSIGLTGVAHTMDAYRRLPHGWRTTPVGMPTDHWMWLQFMELPGIRVAKGDRLTYLTFPDPVWGKLPDDERADRARGLVPALARARIRGRARPDAPRRGPASCGGLPPVGAAGAAHGRGRLREQGVAAPRATRPTRPLALAEARRRLIRTEPPICFRPMATLAAGIDGLDQLRKDAPSVESDGTAIRELIEGAAIRRAPTHADERGTLTEIFDPRWGFTDDPVVYAYHVTLRPGQIRGWALHLEQYDRLFIYAGVLRVVLYDARTDSGSHGRVNVFHLGAHDRALLRIPTGVYHAVQNVGDVEGAFVNLPSQPYRHDDPDKYRLPLDNDVIPYRF